jgi:hypothetical protein
MLVTLNYRKTPDCNKILFVNFAEFKNLFIINSQKSLKNPIPKRTAILSNPN